MINSSKQPPAEVAEHRAADDVEYTPPSKISHLTERDTPRRLSSETPSGDIITSLENPKQGIFCLYRHTQACVNVCILLSIKLSFITHS